MAHLSSFSPRRLARGTLRALFGRRLPRYDGELLVNGLKGPLTIRRDRWAIPYISASEDSDAWFGLGFCQGQDRAFQCELFLRVCRGRLSELIGKRGLPIDQLSRRIGFCRDARQQFAACSPEAQEMMRSFVAGINAGATRGSRGECHELALLRARRTHWEVEDVVGMMRFVAFIHAMSWDTQLARWRILQNDGAQALRDLEPLPPADDPCSLPPGAPFGEVVERLTAELAALEKALGKGGASNNWVIGAARTRNGRPLLANDPHLDPALPCQFYLAHVSGPSIRVAGATFVGSPAFAAGHNGDCAWGVTNGKADGVRLFFEDISSDGKRARCNGHWEDCRVEQERINVRFGKPVIERITITPRGPIISPAVDESIGISMAATWLKPVAFDGFITGHRAKDVETFYEHFREWPGALINLVAADKNSKLGWRLVGDLPNKEADYGYLPRKAQPTDFAETRPFERMPHFIGGENDAFGTANNPPHPDLGHEITGLHWTGGYRAKRIYESLNGRDDWDIDACLELQMDLTSIPWRQIRETVLSTAITDGDAKLAMALLSAWHGRVEADSAGAAIFELFLHELTRRIAASKAPNTTNLALGGSVHRFSPFTNLAMQRFGHTSRLLQRQPPGWFANGWAEQIEQSLAFAVAQLQQKLGSDASRWRWGALRPLTLKHPLSDLGPLAAAFNLGPFPWGGDTSTLNMATSEPLDCTVNPIVIATLRFVAEVGAPDQTRATLHAGQSGNPLSPHYDDMLPLWQRGEAATLPFTEEAIASRTVHTLTLNAG
ncbi:MAG: penicillin acylase family protein [Deltaproteobacteria bacterium]|nr:penicillin acylase family protein [Deltaproteobacteria bacterium]